MRNGDGFRIRIGSLDFFGTLQTIDGHTYPATEELHIASSRWLPGKCPTPNSQIFCTKRFSAYRGDGALFYSFMDWRRMSEILAASRAASLAY
jgi:hypothetical protein